MKSLINRILLMCCVAFGMSPSYVEAQVDSLFQSYEQLEVSDWDSALLHDAYALLAEHFAELDPERNEKLLFKMLEAAELQSNYGSCYSVSSYLLYMYEMQGRYNEALRMALKSKECGLEGALDPYLIRVAEMGVMNECYNLGAFDTGFRLMEKFKDKIRGDTTLKIDERINLALMEATHVSFISDPDTSYRILERLEPELLDKAPQWLHVLYGNLAISLARDGDPELAARYLSRLYTSIDTTEFTSLAGFHTELLLAARNKDIQAYEKVLRNRPASFTYPFSSVGELELKADSCKYFHGDTACAQRILQQLMDTARESGNYLSLTTTLISIRKMAIAQGDTAKVDSCEAELDKIVEQNTVFFRELGLEPVDDVEIEAGVGPWKLTDHPILLVIIISCGAAMLIFVTLSRGNTQVVQLGERGVKLDAALQADLSARLDNFFSDPDQFAKPEVTVEYLSKALKTNKTYLNAVVQQEHGKSLLTLINERKVDHFVKLVDDGKLNDYTYEAIATMAGFGSKSSFHKNFKKLKGVTPSQYFKQHGGGTPDLSVDEQA